MRRLLVVSACCVASTLLAAPPGEQSSAAAGRAVVVLDNPRVRIFKTRGPSFTGVEHRAGVVVPLDDGANRKAGDAYWAADAGARIEPSGGEKGSFIIVEPKDGGGRAPAPAVGSKPGEAVFTGMSFSTLLENDKVTLMRARMEVGAREGQHTHGSDTIVVHLSGGSIEDTANGKTTVNRWKHGDVEFEGLGSSHSARNVGAAVDVVLVALKP
jgi:quercetin dioxygenase-like cupin family protein